MWRLLLKFPRIPWIKEIEIFGDIALYEELITLIFKANLIIKAQ